MTADFDRNELLKLIDATCARTASAEDHARLENILNGSEEARQLYFEYVDFHLGLKQVTQDSPLVIAPPAIEMQLPPELLPAPRSNSSLLSYALVAVAAIGLSLLIQMIFFPQDRPVAVDPAPSTEMPKVSPQYIATFGAQLDCQWSDPEASHGEGWRLLPGELHLIRGVAEIRFDSGAALVIQGPTRLRIESAREATLIEGSAVLHGDEVSDGFSLHTPDATLIDIGTEYAVSVDREGRSEVHVFDGIVLRRSKKDDNTESSEELTAGEAKRFESTRSVEVPLDAERFTREVPKPLQPQSDVKAEVLALDHFEYNVDYLPTEGSGNNGVGWQKAWRGSRTKPGLEVRPATEMTTSPLDRLGNRALWKDGIGEIGRMAETPIDLGVDGVYYISFLFRRDAGDQKKYFQFRLHQNRDWDNEKMLHMGVAHPSIAFIDFCGQSARTHLPLDKDTAYIVVAKIVAGRDRPDQVFLAVYRADEPLESQEPASWTLVSMPVDSDARLDDFWFLFRGEGSQWIDELRIGRTWRSVTAEYEDSL